MLVAHRQDQHGTSRGPQWEAKMPPLPPPPPYPRLYRVSFPRAARLVKCPVEGCEGRAPTFANLRIHFVHRHVRDMIVIM